MTRHPTSSRLLLAATGADSPAALHAETCARCTRVVGSLATEPLPTPPIDLRASTPLLELLKELMPARTPALNEIWRAEWDGRAELVVVVARPEDDPVSVAAVDTSNPDASRAFRARGVAEAGLAGFVAVLPGPPISVPRYALDRRVGRIENMPTPRGERPHWELRAAYERLRRLADDASIAAAEPAVASTVGELLHSHGIGRDDLRHAGLSRRNASLILQDRQSPTPTQIDMIAQLTGIPSEELEERAGRPEGTLVVLLHAPANRPKVAERAREVAAPVPAVRRNSALAIAATARRTERGAEIDWQREIDAYFRS